jgi:hypothetical protein
MDKVRISLCFSGWSKVQLSCAVNLYLHETKKPYPSDAFDSLYDTYFQELGTDICVPKHMTIKWFDILIPRKLDVEQIKKYIKFYHDDHLMGKGVVCHVRAKAYLLHYIQTANPTMPIRVVQDVSDLLNQIEIRPRVVSFPKVTQKGIEVLEKWHQKYCLLDKEGYKCDCIPILTQDDAPACKSM